MYQERILLNPDDILSKEFKIDTRGYRLPEVDQFLDTVMKDYHEFIKIIREIEEEKKTLISDNLKIKSELRNLQMKIDIAQQGGKEVTNVDLFRRISQLEKIVYGQDE